MHDKQHRIGTRQLILFPVPNYMRVDSDYNINENARMLRKTNSVFKITYNCGCLKLKFASFSIRYQRCRFLCL